jgi:ABC-type glycerol-3-phosphate transport system permease component
MRRIKWLVPALYIAFLMLPIYWLLCMSFKNTNEILGSFTLWPRNVTVQARTGLRAGTRDGAGRSDGAGDPWSAAMQACVT